MNSISVDALIILAYFAIIMIVAIRARLKNDVSPEEYFLSGRNLKWYSIAASTIATNIHAGHLLAVMGSAYAYGLAQANFELNAVLGIVIAAFIMVPLYLKRRVITVTEFFEEKFGARIATTYSLLMMFLYATMYLGTTLFWGGYALEIIFQDQMAQLASSQGFRIAFIILLLGGFSATYTYFGGLGAVVKTDLVQFVLLLGGGLTITYLSIQQLGGMGSFYKQLGDKMHLHLPNDHLKLPWLGIITMNLLNLQYWGCNQVILQRSLAAANLRHAQVGLLVGGAFKYITATILVLPGIALIGILGRDNPLSDPDQAFLKIVDLLLSPGVKGLVLCGLFASLMSSVDSIFNSVSTMWSLDIYKKRINPQATDAQIVAMGKKSILATLLLGIGFGLTVTYVKLMDKSTSLDPFFKLSGYVIKNGFVILVVAAIFLVKPRSKWVLATLVGSIPLTLWSALYRSQYPYLITSGLVIVGAIALLAVLCWKDHGRAFSFKGLWVAADKKVELFGLLLIFSWLLTHIIFH